MQSDNIQNLILGICAAGEKKRRIWELVSSEFQIKALRLCTRLILNYSLHLTWLGNRNIAIYKIFLKSQPIDDTTNFVDPLTNSFDPPTIRAGGECNKQFCKCPKSSYVL